MIKDIIWKDFFYGGSFDNIIQGENKVWIVAIEQDPFENMISSELLFEVDDKNRNDLLAVDSYTEYRYTNKNEDNACSPEGIATKYTFLHKILDCKNNLILISDEEKYKFGGSEEYSNGDSRIEY